MEKPEKDKPATSAPKAEAPKKESRIPLREFSLRLSQTDRRVEMIGAFTAMEAKVGRVSDIESAYKARYDAFCTAPA